MARRPPDTIGSRIAHARRELGVRRHEDIPPAGLAKLLEVEVSTVTRWEADISAPTGVNLIRLAEVLHVPADWIIRGSIATTERQGTQSGGEFLNGENDSGAHGGRRKGGGGKR